VGYLCGRGGCAGGWSSAQSVHPRKVFANYYHGSPSALLPLGVRHVTINGALDDIVPLDYVRPFVDIASKLGDDATLIPIPDVGHFEIVMPTISITNSDIFRNGKGMYTCH